MEHWPATIEALPDSYTVEAKKKAILSYGGLLTYLRLRALGMWSVEKYNRSLRKYCPPSTFRGSMALLIGFVPTSLMSALYSIWVKLTPELRS
jgi:hypothetical protein